MDCDNLKFKIKHFDVIDSTNSYIRRESDALWSETGEGNAIVVYADRQTAGRGQRGNVWHSHGGENLLVSIAVRPSSLAVTSQFVLSQAIALAVRDALSGFGIEAQLKWPNDIYVGKRKLAGILVELDYYSSLLKQAVIGVGLNINQTQFDAMDKIPVSMKMLLSRSFSVETVLDALLSSFSRYYAMVERGEFAFLSAEYKKYLMGYGVLCKYHSGNRLFDAVIVDVEPCGHLRLRCNDGQEASYAFKEVEPVL